MKRRIMKVLAFIPLLFFSVYVQAESMQSFALKNAHQRGFFKCDNVIRDVFLDQSPPDMRINTSWFDELDEVLRMTAVFGKEGDSVYADVFFIVKGETCFAMTNTLIDNNQNCAAVVSDIKGYKYESQTGDYTWGKNSGNALVITSNRQPSKCPTFYHISRKEPVSVYKSQASTGKYKKKS